MSATARQACECQTCDTHRSHPLARGTAILPPQSSARPLFLAAPGRPSDTTAAGSMRAIVFRCGRGASCGDTRRSISLPPISLYDAGGAAEDTPAGRAEMVRTILGCAMLLGGMAAAATEAGATADGKRIAVFMGPTQDKYLGALSRTFDTTASGYGMKVTVYSSPFDPALQAQQLDDAIAQKFDFFVVQIISQRAIIPVLTRVRNAGIPVALVVAPMVGNEAGAQDLYLTHVGYDDTAFGGLIGEAMVKALQESGRNKAKIAVLAGSMAEGKAPLREQAFREAVAKQPGMEVVITEDVKWNPAVGERAAGQLLARFAGQGGLDGFYGMNDVVGNGGSQAAESAGVKVGTGKGDLIVVGGNCQAPGVKNIETGKQAATLLMLPVEEGKITATKVKEFFEGKKPEKITFLPTETITKANLAKYARPCSY